MPATWISRINTYNCNLGIVYTFNSFRNVCNFWQVVPNGSALTKLLLQVYVSQEILQKTKKTGKVQVNMQRIKRNAGSFSGLVIDLKKILNIERWNKDWIDLCLVSCGWYIIKNVWWKRKISLDLETCFYWERHFFITFQIIMCFYHRNISMLILRLFF